jgi:hypothetical protein
MCLADGVQDAAANEAGSACAAGLVVESCFCVLIYRKILVGMFQICSEEATSSKYVLRRVKEGGRYRASLILVRVASSELGCGSDGRLPTK